MLTPNNSILGYLKFTLGRPIRVGKSYFAIIVYGILLSILTTLLGYIIVFIVQGFSASMEFNSPIDMIRFEAITAIFSLLYNLNYYFFAAMIIYVCLEVSRVKFVLPRDVRDAAKMHYKTLLVLIFIIWIIGYLMALPLDNFRKPQEQWMSSSYRYLIKPFISMCFMICVATLLMSEANIKSILKTLWKILNVARYSFLIMLFIFCAAALYLPVELTNLVRNPIMNRIYEENGLEVTNSVIAINIGFQLLNIMIAMVILSVTSAAAIYTVRSAISR